MKAKSAEREGRKMTVNSQAGAGIAGSTRPFYPVTPRATASYSARSIFTLRIFTSFTGLSLGVRGAFAILSATCWPSITAPKMV